MRQPVIDLRRNRPALTLVLACEPHVRQWLSLTLVMARHVVLTFDEPHRLLAFLRGTTEAPGAVVADQRSLGDHLATLATRLGALSDQPRLVVVADPERPLFMLARRQRGVAAVLEPPIARHQLLAAVRALDLHQRAA